MRAAANILFGIMLLVMQSMAALAPHSIELEQACQCCSCGSKACATTQRVPAPPVSPIAVAETAREAARKTEIAPSHTSPRSLVVPVAKQQSPAPVTFPSSSNLPLHQRLCVLLI